MGFDRNRAGTDTKDFESYVLDYLNDGEHNDRLHRHFTSETDKVPYLKEHRDFIEQNRLGFGDRAFHYMWFLLLSELKKTRHKPRLLEIGVYKGQVVSLWSLLAAKLGFEADIFCISPMEGNVSKRRVFNNRIMNAIRSEFSSTFRNAAATGNLYGRENYEAAIRGLFEHFELSFESISVMKGFSNDSRVLGEASRFDYDLVYIDGDHTYKGVLDDIENYSALIIDGGFLVMDDASYYLDGTSFWKGHEEVSRACKQIETFGFQNVLNVGHNRVYRKTG